MKRLRTPRFSRRRALIAGFGAVVVPAHVTTAQRVAQVTLEEFGGGVGLADNTIAMAAALSFLAERGGGVLNFGSGHYRFRSASLSARSGIEVPGNVELAGRGKDATLLEITGNIECHFLLNENGASNHFVHDLSVRGNGTATANGPGNFYYCSVLSGRAAKDVANCRFADMRLENFGGDFWIRFYCTSPSYQIRVCGIEHGCEAISRPGNARRPDSLGTTSFVVEFRGDGGVISDCFVRGLSARLEWVKGGVAAFGRVERLVISNVVLADAFMGYRVPDRGAYAILLYDTGPDDVVTGTLIERAVVSNPFSCGLYLAGTRSTRILDPIVFGQSDTADGTLPKAAIALNGANDIVISNPNLSGNACDIQIAGISGPEYDADMNIRIEGGKGTGARLAGVKLRSSSYVLQSGGISFIGYRSETEVPRASGMVWQLHPDFHGGGKPSGIRGVSWVGGACSGGMGGYDVNLNWASSADNPSGELRIADATLGGVGVRASVAAVGCNGGDISLSNVTFAGQAGRHLLAERCRRLVLDDVRFTGTVFGGVHVVLDRTPYSARRVVSSTAHRLFQVVG